MPPLESLLSGPKVLYIKQLHAFITERLYH